MIEYGMRSSCTVIDHQGGCLQLCGLCRSALADSVCRCPPGVPTSTVIHHLIHAATSARALSRLFRGRQRNSSSETRPDDNLQSRACTVFIPTISLRAGITVGRGFSKACYILELQNSLLRDSHPIRCVVRVKLLSLIWRLAGIPRYIGARDSRQFRVAHSHKLLI